MTCTDFSGVLGIVLKILTVQRTILIADQAIIGNNRRIEFHLKLYILTDGEQSSCHFLHQHLPSLPQTINVCIVSVSLVRKDFHLVILQIPCSEAKHRKVNTGLLLFRDQFLQFFLRSKTDIQIPICCQDDPVIPALDKVFLSNLISGLDALASVCAAACLKTIDCPLNLPGFIPGCSPKHYLVIPCIGNNRDSVLFCQIFSKKSKRFL